MDTKLRNPEMNVYFIQGGEDKNKTDILISLKQAVRDRLPEADVDPIFSLTYDNENQFFLKKSGEVVWGRVFYQPFCVRFAEMIQKELARMQQSLKQAIKLVIFFPTLTAGEDLLRKMPGNPLIFEYYFMQSKSGRAIAIREWSKEGPAEKEMTPPQGAYRFFKQAKLTRQELSEIIDLSLELKK